MGDNGELFDRKGWTMSVWKNSVSCLRALPAPTLGVWVTLHGAVLVTLLGFPLPLRPVWEVAVALGYLGILLIVAGYAEDANSFPEGPHFITVMLLWPVAMIVVVVAIAINVPLYASAVVGVCICGLTALARPIRAALKLLHGYPDGWRTRMW